VIVRETVPDSVIEQADEIELIDLPPDELLQRLREGKVYMPQQAEQATRNFFRKGNLIALREMALRRTADRVDAQMQHYRRDNAITDIWAASERILVCISPSPHAVRLVRAARRMVARLRAEWLVVYVELPAHARLPEVDRERVIQTLRLAEQLGAEVITLSGTSVSEEVLRYARTRNVTKIVVGKPEQPRWKEMLFGSVVETIVRRSGVIDVYVLTGDYGDTEALVDTPLERHVDSISYAWGAVAVVISTLVAWLMRPFFAEADLIMTYLLSVLIVAARYGRGPSILASVLSILAFNFFFCRAVLHVTGRRSALFADIRRDAAGWVDY
jgi:two-component system sensor histidine kinase KdpD